MKCSKNHKSANESSKSTRQDQSPPSHHKQKGLSKNRWGLGVPLRNPGVDYPGEEKQLQTYMGRHSGLLFFVFADYYAVRHQQKGKGSESSFPATSEPTTKTMVSVSHSQYKIVKHPNHLNDF